MPRLRILVIALIVDGTDVGETWSGFHWVKAMAEVMDVTLLCMQRPGRTPTAEQLPGVRVISWPEPAFLGRFERARAMLKPAWPLFVRHVRRWLADALARGEQFDIAHQLLPQAMRHASPLRHFALPYVVGPLGGSLATPPAFEQEVGGGGGLARLRAFDGFRLRHDPALRAGYARAGAILGVAPYVGRTLADAGVAVRRFETVLERSADPIAHGTGRSTAAGAIRLLHVGRCVRTKGLRDAVRALARLGDLPGVTLTSAGDGPDLAACKAEAAALGVADRVDFLGKVSRDRVEQLYADHDVFCFPSFREPMGGVFFEALRWGLPVISARRGGPEAIVDESCGILVPVETPDQFAAAIAEAIRALAADPALRICLGNGAHQRLQSFGAWSDKARWLESLYREVIAAA